MVNTLEEHCEVKALPLDRSTETIVNFRNVSVTDSLAVIGVDYTVIIEVDISDVTWLRIEERLVCMSVNFSLTLEEAI